MSKKVLLMLLLMAVFAPWAANAQKALPYSYGFENNDLDAEGWMVQKSSSGTGINTNAAYEGIYGFRFSFSEQNAYLVSPVFTTNANSLLSVSFYYSEYSSYYGDEQFYVGYTTDETATDPSAFTYGDIITASTSWAMYENTFPAGTKRVAIKYVYNDAYYLYLDEFEFNGVNSSCLPPASLDVSLTPGNGTVATLSWTSDADAWQICLNDNEDNLIEANSNPYTLTGLTPEEAYTAKVRAVCGTEQSVWSNTVSFTPTDAYRLTVGEGTITDRTVPMYVYYFDDYTRAQSVIPASELVAMSGGYITAITFYTTADNIPYTTVSTFDIYLAEVADATITAFVDRSAATTVFTNGTGEFVNDGSGGGLITITFETPYLYNGGNLLIGCDNNTDTGFKSINFSGDAVTGASISGYNASSTNNVTPTQRNFRPKTTFDFVPAGIDYCPRPTGLTATNVTTTSATLSWTESGEATEWNLRYKVADRRNREVYDFDDSSFEGWTTIDADGDGYDWVLGSECGGVYYESQLINGLTGQGHESSADFMISGSYTRYPEFAPLTPDNYLVSPLLNLGGSISFWACAQDSDYASEHFGVAVSTTGNTNAADFTTIQEWTMTARSMGAPTMMTRSGNRGGQGVWFQYTVDLSAYSGQGYVAIRHFNCTDMYFLDVDDISFSNESLWTNVEGLTATNYTLTGLDPATTYEVQVRAVCGEDNTSTWTNSVNFTTDCVPIATLPWSENFDSYINNNNDISTPSDYPNVVLPTCWQFLNRSQSSNSYPQVFLTAFWSYVVSGNALLFRSSNTTPVYAILPEFEDAVSGKQITFTYNNMGENNDFYGTLHVGYMTDPTDANTFTSVYACPQRFATEITVYLPDTPANSYIAFMYCCSQNNGAYLSIDNVTVDVAPTCLPVNTLSYSEVDALSATLSWSLYDNNQTAWDVQYATTEDFSEGVQLIENVNIHENYLLEGLSQGSHYYVRVRANCGDDDVSAWSNIVEFTTDVSCHVPTDFAVADVTAHTAELSWTGTNDSYNVKYKPINNLEAEGFDNSSIPSGWDRYTGLLSEVMNGTAPASTNYGWQFGSSNGVFDNHARINLYSTSCRFWLVTPNIALESDNELSFDMAFTAYSGTLAAPNTTGLDDKFVVLASTDDGATWTILRQWDNQGSQYVLNDITCSATGEHVIIELADYNGQTVRIAFYGESTESNADNHLHIDNVAISASDDWQTVSTDELSVILTGLASETSYEAMVQGVCEEEVSSWSSPISFTTLISCYTPTNLSVSNVDPYHVGLSWIANGDEEEWQICLNGDENDLITATTNPFTLTGLNSETNYSVKVRANCGNGDVSAWSNVVNFSTPIACAVPINFAVSNISNLSALVTWTAGNSSQNQWELQYRTVGEEEWTSVNGLTETTYTFSGLTSGVGYEVRVRANCGTIYGVSDWTNTISFVANFCPLEEQCIINYSLTDSWGDGWNGNAIQVVDLETNTVYATITLTSGSSESGSIGLCPDRTYNFIWINGSWNYECSFLLTDANGNEILAGDHSDLPFNFANCTVTCKRPKNLTTNTVGAYSAVLTWVSGEAWDFAYKAWNADHFTIIENLEDNTYTLSDLTPEATYIVKVRGNCGDEVSYWSDEYFFTTTEACVKPTNLQASVSMESALITWTAGSEDQSEWDLQYRMAGQSEWTTITGLTEPNYTITSLGNSTTYYVRVRSVCEVPSNWTYSISFISEQIYVFNTYVDEDVYPMNTSIPIHGTVTSNLTSAPVANLEVEIGVTVMGWRRTLTAITDANGQFATSFEPISYESGYYTVNSGTVGSNSDEVHDSFDIMGMHVMEYTLNEEMEIENSSWLLCNVIQNEPKTGHILIRNRNSFPLTNVQVSVLSAPAGAEFTFTPINVAGLQEGYLEYSALGTILTQGSDYQEVILKATCSQGAEAIFTMWFYCEEARGILNISPTVLNTTMTKGVSKTIDVTLSNNGHAATGEITINLPNEDWMAVVGETTLPSIEVGETATFTLRLSPDNTVPLAQYSGNIVVSCDHGESVTIPYSILAVSEENGTLVVDVTDEFTTNTNNGNGPHVEGAEVTLKGYYSQETVAHGFTAADGTFTVEDLAEGYYNLSVQAGAHSRYDGTIYVEAGVTNQQNVFLQYQCVSYSWHVEPTDIPDEYTIVLDMEFEVEVPVPIVTIEVPSEISFDNTYTFNYVITNHGLIDACNLTLYTPESDNYLFTALYNHIETLPAQSSIEIPCMVTRKGILDPTDCGEWLGSELRYGYYSGQDLIFNQSHTFSHIGRYCSNVVPSITQNGPGSGGIHITPRIENQLPTVDVRVGVQFSQQLTMTREAFVGAFDVLNGHATNATTGIGLDFVIRNEEGADCTNLFQIATQSIDGVTSIDGNGTLAAGAEGLVQILFIPTKEAAPTEPVVYSFGGTFTFVDPWDFETRVMNLYPTELEVHPSPDLYIDFFVQEDVYGDNPITPDSIEPILPAELAVRIWNKGAGTAKNVILESAEPVIVSNQQGLIIDFGLYGAYIDGVGTQPGLNSIEFGDIESGETKVGEWLFTSALLAHVVSYDAHVIHNNSYGNPNLSLVSHLGIHKLTHPIHTFGTRVDAINDFLVDDIPDENNYPDSIFFSNGGRTSVGVVEGISFDKFVTPHDTIVTLTVNPSRIGWNYGETEDPGKNRYELVSCTRNNDGENIPLSNVWQESIILHETGDSLYANKLRIVDTVSVVQTVTYTLVFAGNPSDPYIFFGDEDEYWSNVANWEGFVKPLSQNDNVIIDGECLLDEDATVKNVLIVEDKRLTIPDGRILTVSNNLENAIASGLVIEEGGQLMHSNAGTQAVFEKGITPYTPGTKDGWHLVAHPMASNVAITSVEDMMVNEYDLYYYNEPTVYWINQEDASNNFTELENGKGYLYGNNEEVLLKFAGDLQNGSAMVEIPLSYTTGPRLAGFNLVGNPYAHNITTYTSVNVVDGCFVMNDPKDDLVVSEINSDNPLKPGEGFFVKATDENASITFNPQRIDMMNPKGAIRVELTENGKLVDRLIVKTDEGQPLEKFSLNEQRTKLFAEGDSQELAIVPCRSNEQPVSFKASKNGQYTVAVNTDGMEFDYLHLVDNLTGKDVDLLVDPSYTFDARTSDYASRFLLRFIMREGNASETENFVFFFNDKLVIANEGRATLQVVDLLGRILESEQINGSCEKQLHTAPGVYMFRLINGDNVKVQKVVVER